MPLNTLKDLLVRQLSELHDAEKHCLEAFPKLAKAAASPKLAQTIRSHVEQTKEHVSRLDRIFTDMKVTPGRAETKGMRGLLDDCLHFATMSDAEPHVRDAALVAMAQGVKHDEIAGYGCARAWADLLGMRDTVTLLQKTLSEERQTDAELTKVAETLNREAVKPAMAR